MAILFEGASAMNTLRFFSLGSNPQPLDNESSVLPLCCQWGIYSNKLSGWTFFSENVVQYYSQWPEVIFYEKCRVLVLS